jgi:4-hydroxyphenylpyruvate dioxygenase-like putative hemolysin
MSDIYEERPGELAQFYAQRFAEGFGPNAARKLGWTVRDAEAAGDRRRARFWGDVRARLEARQLS